MLWEGGLQLTVLRLTFPGCGAEEFISVWTEEWTIKY